MTSINKKAIFFLMAGAINFSSAAESNLKEIIVNGEMSSLEEREAEVASKSVISRKNIEEYGDSNIWDLLRRVPGITVSGSNNSIYFRGLGDGYTQILVDGRPASTSLPIGSIAPTQIERIEIFRTPTAETGAQAIAGTINIVLRKISSKDSEKLTIIDSFGAHQSQQSFGFILNKTTGDISNNTSIAGANVRQTGSLHSATTANGLVAGYPASIDESDATTTTRRTLTAVSRWAMQIDKETSLTFTPTFAISEGGTTGIQQRQFNENINGYGSTALAAQSHAIKIAGGLIHKWETSRLELGVSLGEAHQNNSFNNMRTDPYFGPLNYENTSDRLDRELALNAKYISAVDTNLEVFGLDYQRNSRRQTQGATLGFDGENNSTQSKLSAFYQNENAINSKWSSQIGIRLDDLTINSNQAGTDQQFSYFIAAPSAHIKFTPIEKGRDQIRLGLARTYKPPQLAQLFSPYTFNQLAPTSLGGIGNTPLTYDSSGNPSLRPETATGLDIGFEHYYGANGLISANFFYRKIENYTRTLVFLQPTAYGNRYVASYYNAGRATTQGVELDVRSNLNDMWAALPKIATRIALSIYKSHIENANFGNATIDRQPSFLLQTSASYQIPKSPISIGGAVNIAPSLTVQTSADRLFYQGRMITSEVYSAWSLNQKDRLKLSVSGFLMRSSNTREVYMSNQIGQSQYSSTPTYVAVALQFEHEFK